MMKIKSFLFLLLLFLVGEQLEVYAQTNPSSEEVVKVACVGNSITYGSGIAHRDSLSYPAQLQRMIGEKMSVRNFGVSGRTVLKKGDHPYWKEKAFQEVQEWNPDVVVIMLGTNDTKPQNWNSGSEFTQDYRDFVKTFKALSSQPEIWVALPVPVFKENKYKIRDSVIRVEIPIIKQIAKQEKVKLLNLNKALKPYGQYFADGVHPDKTGAHYMARAVYKKIRKYRKANK